MSLKEYQRKRKFDETPEPSGKEGQDRGPLRFVVQKHDATRLHYDLRLEWGGTLKSWAVPKGPSLNPMDQRLAVFVEDHPLEYGSFEGTIPKDNYGAGTVLLWDAGTLVERGSQGRADSEEALVKGFAKGHITFVLNGHKLKGEFALVKIGEGDPKAWLLVKKRDRFSSSKGDVLAAGNSVKSGRSMDEIAAQRDGNVWIPGKGPEQFVEPVAYDQQAPLPASALGADVEIPDARPAVPPAPQMNELATGPRPRSVKPMQPLRFPKPFSQEGWYFLPDYGGLHVLCERENKSLRFYTRGGLRKTYKTLTPHLQDLPEGLFAVELLVEDQGEFGRPSKEQEPTHVIVYDVWYLNGIPFATLPYAQRRELLQAAFVAGEYLRLADIVTTEGADAYQQFISSGAHGMLAIARDSLLAQGINKQFLRIEGPSNAEGVGSTLPPATYDTAASTRQVLVRHEAALPKNGQRIGDRGPIFTNLDKSYWPSRTKGDLVRYYQLVADALLPHLTDRPLSLHRHPDGISGESFFHKNMTGYFPHWFTTHPVTSPTSGKTINYALCQNEASLLYLANFGCIELNPWFSRLSNLEHPDFCAIDLDPDQTTFAEVREVALTIHGILDSIHAPHHVKTSGSSGLHICIPTDGQATYKESRDFAEFVCRVTVNRHPDLATIERAPSKRRRKMYLDYMQNRRSQTLASVYCVRPKVEATVSAPVTWEEVRAGFAMTDFTMESMPNRLQQVGDLWSPMLTRGADLKELLQKLFAAFPELTNT